MNICFKENGHEYLSHISYMGIDETIQDVKRVAGVKHKNF